MKIPSFKKLVAAMVFILIFSSALVPVSVLAKDNTIPYMQLSYNFFDIEFVNQDLGWVVGQSGLIFKTEDGGLTWQKQETGVLTSIFGVSFQDETNGILVGQSGLVMASENAGSVRVMKVNIDDNPEAAQKFGVMSIPTLMVFKNGDVTDRFVGVQPKAKLQEALDAAKA